MEGKYKQITEVLNLFERSELTEMFVEFDGVRLSVSKKDGVIVPATWEEIPPPAVTTGSAAPAATQRSATLPSPAQQSAPVAAATPLEKAPAAAAQLERAAVEGLHVVRAPMLGTLYRRPSPGEPPFVGEGSQVTADHTLCLIECMKLFNTIPVGVAGRLVRFAVEDATLVEFNQPIAYIEPD